MNDEEKGLMLMLILQDIRSNWGYSLSARVGAARKLAEELKLERVIQRINDFDYEDGRHFRTLFEYGGYEGMEVLCPTISRNYNDKSAEFKEYAKVLTYPGNGFDDGKELFTKYGEWA